MYIWFSQTLSDHQEAGFRRLHNWILQRCNALDSTESDDLEENDVTLSMGLKVIRYGGGGGKYSG